MQSMTVSVVIPKRNWLRCLRLLSGRQIQWELRFLCRVIWDLENKFVSILEDDKEWEEKKLRKAEYEAGKTDGIEIAEERMIHNMIKLDFPIEKIAEVTGKSPLEIEQYLQSNRQ